MKLRFSNYVMKNSLLYFAFCTICILFTYSIGGESSFLPLAIATVVETVIFGFLQKKITGEYFTFATLFFLILALFHFGQVWICGFWGNLAETLRFRIVINYFVSSDSVKAMRLINISFCLFGTGLMTQTYRQNNDANYSDNMVDDSYYQRIAKRIIFVTFPIKIIIDSIFLFYSFAYDFSTALQWNGNFPDFIKIIGNFSIIGFGLLIVSLRKHRSNQLRVFLFIAAYLVLLMISGKRSETVSYLVILAFVYFMTSQRRIKKVRTIIIVCILGYFLLTFLYTTVRFRSNEDKTFAGFFDLFVDLLFKRNIIMEAMREYGNTGYTPICVLINWLNTYSPSYGKSYYLGSLLIFPNIGGIIGRINTEAAYAVQLQNYNMVMPGFRNIGGSIIGELFFNFGVIGGLVFSFIFGCILGKVSNKFNSIIRGNRLNSLMYMLPIMFATTYWIRDTFGNCIREIVWGLLFCYFISKTVPKIRNEV